MASNATKGGATGAVSGAASGAMAGAAFGPYGAIAGGILGGIGGGLSGLLGGGAADDAEKLAEDQAKFIEMETTENVRRMRAAAEEQVGLSKATAYASNLQGSSGTSGKYTNKIRSQWAQDVAWSGETGRQRANIARQGGQTASQGIMNNMFLQQGSQLLGSAASFGAAGGFSKTATPNPNPQGLSSMGPRPSGVPASLGT
jgi:hypothetical protein